MQIYYIFRLSVVILIGRVQENYTNTLEKLCDHFFKLNWPRSSINKFTLHNIMKTMIDEIYSNKNVSLLKKVSNREISNIIGQKYLISNELTR